MLFLLPCISAVIVHIQKYNEEQYITGSKEGPGPVRVGPLSDADEFDMREIPGQPGNFFVSKEGLAVTSGLGEKLEFAPFTEGPTQLFVLKPYMEKWFKLAQGELCITHNRPNNFFAMRDCSSEVDDIQYRIMQVQAGKELSPYVLPPDRRFDGTTAGGIKPESSSLLPPKTF